MRPIYETSFSRSGRNRVLRNHLGSALAAGIFGWFWFQESDTALLVVWLLFAALALFQFKILFIKHPLQLFTDKIVYNMGLTLVLPIETIVRTSMHSRRKEPCLIHRHPDSGKENELIIHWKYIAEPKEEVMQQIGNLLRQRDGAVPLVGTRVDTTAKGQSL